MEFTISYWAVLVSAIVSMIIGSIWYGPLFGKKFMQAKGMNKWSLEEQAKMKKAMTMTYIWQFIASLVMFYVLAWLIGALGMVSIMGGTQVAMLVWVGFVVPLALGDALWGGEITLFWLGAGNMLLTLAAAGAIIGAWK